MSQGWSKSPLNSRCQAFYQKQSTSLQGMLGAELMKISWSQTNPYQCWLYNVSMNETVLVILTLAMRKSSTCWDTTVTLLAYETRSTFTLACGWITCVLVGAIPWTLTSCKNIWILERMKEPCDGWYAVSQFWVLIFWFTNPIFPSCWHLCLKVT